jgi:hypothetical protein
MARETDPPDPVPRPAAPAADRHPRLTRPARTLPPRRPHNGHRTPCGTCAPPPGARLAACLPKHGRNRRLHECRPLSHPKGTPRQWSASPPPAQPGQAGDQTKTKIKGQGQGQGQDQDLNQQVKVGAVMHSPRTLHHSADLDRAGQQRLTLSRAQRDRLRPSLRPTSSLSYPACRTELRCGHAGADLEAAARRSSSRISAQARRISTSTPGTARHWINSKGAAGVSTLNPHRRRAMAGAERCPETPLHPSDQGHTPRTRATSQAYHRRAPRDAARLR